MTSIDEADLTCRDERQRMTARWAAECFGESEMNLKQRALRLLEEATEAYQAVGGSLEMANKLTSYVFGRPAGEIGQEVGGVGVTLLVLAEAAGLSADTAESEEVRRILAKPRAHFTKRNRCKNDLGLIEVSDWEQACLRWRKRILTGDFAHSCPNWDGLPIDETCKNEWPCGCDNWSHPSFNGKVPE